MITRAGTPAATLKSVDLVVILTDHSKYDYQFIVDNAKAVFDSRNATRKVVYSEDKVVRL